MEEGTDPCVGVDESGFREQAGVADPTWWGTSLRSIVIPHATEYRIVSR
jgi:hypothetical protein